MINLDEEKIEFPLGNKDFCFLAGLESRERCVLFFTSRFAAFICLDSWYCQIQTTRLFMFFDQLSKIFKCIFNILSETNSHFLAFLKKTHF